MDESETNDKNIYNNEFFEIFVIHILSSGDEDVPFWSETKRILEVVVSHPRSDQKYHAIASVGYEVRLPPASNDDRYIGRDVISFSGREMKLILTEAMEFIETLRNGKKAVLFTLKAIDVMTMLAKEFFLEGKMDLGKDFCLFPYHVFDVTKYAEDRLKELQYTYSEYFQPHSLTRISDHYQLGVSYYKLFRCTGATVATERLLERVVLPKLEKDYASYEKWVWLLHNQLKTLLQMDRRVSDIAGVEAGVSENLHKVVHEFLERRMDEEEYEEIRHTHELFRVADLLMYASVKMDQLSIKIKGEDGLRAACKCIENLLRSTQICIEKDNVIVSVLAAMCCMTDFDFMYHTSVSTIESFPCIRNNNSICFKPLPISDEDALIMGKKFNIWSLTQLYTVFLQMDALEQENFLNNINLSLHENILMPNVDKAFKLFKEKNYTRMKALKAKKR